MSYTGRFAPSPTGPLHMGSLIAAVASYLQAISQNGKWLLRIEDLDPPREITGASDDIIRMLDASGFEWDGEIVYQSLRTDYYEQALEQLSLSGLSYPCGCSRGDIALAGKQTALGLRYPGTCRQGLPDGKPARSTRIKAEAEDIRFCDKVQGEVLQNLNQDCGDFVIKRADGQIAYQLAVVIDDALQGITEIVRGSDLLDSTARQIYLQQSLGYPTPDYAHIPVLVNRHGNKLSKQNLAAPISKDCLSSSLFHALCYLQQTPPDELSHAPLNEIWAWAKMNWQLEKVVKQLSIPE